MPSKRSRTPTATPHPVRPAELARRLGRARSTVTELLQGPWREALLPSGRVDASHKVIQDAARARGIDPRVLLDAPRTPTVTGKKNGAAKNGATEAPDPTLEALLDMRLRDISDAFGSSQAFRDWIAARKLVAETERIESRNARDAGRLISRELVRLNVFGALRQLAMRLLQDLPTTLATRARSALPREESVPIIRDLISSELENTKRRAIKGLRSAEISGTVDPPEVHDETDPARDPARPVD
ncbi:MAG: hypothetical protein M3020_24220 [Myxococcota bacterium]|nr:hypothetical protein [Myxococcota bacterium]